MLGADRFDAEPWNTPAAADLLGVALPEEPGGSALGLVEVCRVLERQGRSVVPVPLWSTAAPGTLPLVRVRAGSVRGT